MSITKTFRKKRRSLVRFLASCVPDFLWEFFFPVPPRMYISASLIQKLSGSIQNNFPADDSNTSFCSFKKNFHSKNQQLILNSTPKKPEDIEDDRLKILQEELLEVKKMIAKLMERQTGQCSGCRTLNNHSDQLQKSFVPPPPPPPPPPNFSVLPVSLPLEIKKKKNPLPQYGFPCGKELLRDLKKVQLKKVEKSPGGGPVKKSNKLVNDPGDILAAVLRKRFDCIQNSLDSSLDCAELENSFAINNTSIAINNSYEIGKDKITVL